MGLKNIDSLLNIWWSSLVLRVFNSLSLTYYLSGGWGTLLGVLSNLGVVSGVVMGIGHIFKIDDRYTNIDR